MISSSPSDRPARPDPRTSLVGRLTLRAQIALRILLRSPVSHPRASDDPGAFADALVQRTDAVLGRLEASGDVTYPAELQTESVGLTRAEKVDRALDRASDVTGAFRSAAPRPGLPALPAHEPPALVYSRDPSLPWDEYRVLSRMLDRLVRLAGDRAATLTRISPVARGMGHVTQPMLEALDGPLQERADEVMAAVTDLVRAALGSDLVEPEAEPEPEPKPTPEPVPGPSTYSTPTGAKLVTTLVPRGHELLLRRLPTDSDDPLEGGRQTETPAREFDMVTRFVDQPAGVRFTGTPPAAPDAAPAEAPTTALREAAEKWFIGAHLRDAARPDDPSRLGRVLLGPGQRETVFGVDLAAGPDEHVEAVFDPRTSPPTLVRLVRRFSTVDTETPGQQATSSAPTPDETSRAPAGRAAADPGPAGRAPAGRGAVQSDQRISSRDADLLNRCVLALDMAGFARAGLALAPEGSEKALEVERTHRILSEAAGRVCLELRDRLAEQGVLPQGPDEREDRVPSDAVRPSPSDVWDELVTADLPPVEGLSPSAQALLTSAVRDVVAVATERVVALTCGWPASLERDTPEGREYLRTEGQLPRMLSHLAGVVSRFTDYEEDRDGGAAPGSDLLQSHSLPQCPDLGEAENARLGAATEALVVVVGERAAAAALLPEESSVRGASPDAPGRRLLSLREAAVQRALHDLSEALADVVSNVQHEAVRAAGRSTADLLKMVTPRPEPDRPFVARGIPDVSPAVDGAPVPAAPAEAQPEPDWARAARTHGLDPQPPLVTRIAVPESNARPATTPAQEEPDPEHTLPTDAPLAECGGSWLLDLLVNMLNESAALVLADKATPGYLNRISADIGVVYKELHKRVVGIPLTVRRTCTRIEPITDLADLTDWNLVTLTLQLCQDSTLSRVEPGGAIGDPTEVSRDFGRASAELYSRIARRTSSQEPAPTPTPTESQLARIIELAERLDQEILDRSECQSTQRACDALTGYLDELRVQAVADELGPDPAVVRSLALDDLIKLRFVVGSLLVDLPPVGKVFRSTDRSRIEAVHDDLISRIHEMSKKISSGGA